MNKLRDKTHIILIILILAFLATIVFEWGMDYLGLRGGVVTELGSVNGQEVKYADFENQVNFAIEQQKQQTGEDPDETVIQLIRDQVWEQMISQILAEQEIKRLGIQVTNQEILNWVYNSPQTLPEPIKRNFIDSTGQFNMAVYQQALATKTPEVQKFWAQVEDYLRQTLLSQKLQSVITATVRVTEGEVLQKFKDENILANFDYIFLDVNSIQDNQVLISEEDLKSYYEKNKENFKRDESVKLRYVLFPDQATMDDTILTEKQLRVLVKELKKFNPADSTTWSVVNDYSLSKYENKFFKPNEISSEVAGYLFKEAKDSISDVIKASDGFHIVKLLDTKEGEDVFVNASHILINFETDTAGAKLKAEQLLQRLKNGEDFAKLSADNSDDPGNKFVGGSLGWFTKGAMVKEFEDAVMGGNIGEVKGPVKTQFGYHLIKINDRQKKEFKFADIKMIVKSSSKTRDAARKQAEDFAYVTRKGNFDEEVKKLGLQITEIPNFITKGSFIPGTGQNKSVTKFGMDEKKGAISDPMKVQNGYAVYMIADKVPAGYISFEEIKGTQLLLSVKVEKKLDFLKQRAEELKGKITGNLSSINTLDTNIKVQSTDSVSVSKPNPLIGTDFDFNNTVFKIQAGQISDPIRTNRGYFIVHMKSITQFDQNKYQQDYEIIKSGILTQKKQTILQDWITELKDKAVIVDNRDKFYR
ncbi:MAG: peptidylprolyl isomerase [Chlorobi bacterium]|nr:peptidylprolyl isomerase [Chlorobiota bacterium]MCI0717059.1 peptidylprolyl isomerase [Chlorobiota bacterium]